MTSVLVGDRREDTASDPKQPTGELGKGLPGLWGWTPLPPVLGGCWQVLGMEAEGFVNPEVNPGLLF